MVAVVFGARGNVGRHVAQGLRALGEQVRVTSRNPAEAGFAPGLQAAAADLERPETLPAALVGAEKVFLYAKPDGVDGFVEAAVSAGVRHVALLSSAAVVHADAEHNPIAVRHRAVELAIEKSGLDWTFIRPGMFATNTLWWWARSIRAENVARAPFPDAQSAPAHEKDIAALAVTALAEPGHGGQAYTIYGPQSLTLRRQVEDIGDAIGRRISFEVPSGEQARRELGQSMFPAGSETILRAWSAGTPAQTSTVVETVTGHPARTFAQWAADHGAEFRSLLRRHTPASPRRRSGDVSGSAGQELEPVTGRGFLGHRCDLQPGVVQLLMELSGFPVEEPAPRSRGIGHRLQPGPLPGRRHQRKPAAGTQDAPHFAQGSAGLVMGHVEQRRAAPDPVEALAGQREAPQICLHDAPGKHPRGVRQHPGRPVDAGDAMSRPREQCAIISRAAPQVGDIPSLGQAGREGSPQLRK